MHSESPSSANSSSTAPAPSLLERLTGLFSSPRRAFEPPLLKSAWLIPLCIVIVAQLAQSFLLRDLTAAKGRALIENNEKFSAEEKAQYLELAEATANKPGMVVLQMGMVLVGILAVGILLPALLYHWGLNFLLAARTRYVEVLGVTILARLVLVLGDLLRTPLMLSRGSIEVYTSPAAFVGTASPVLIQSLNRLDVFDLYRLFLLTIGFSCVSLKPPSRTVIPVLLVWIFGWIVTLAYTLSPLGRAMS